MFERKESLRKESDFCCTSPTHEKEVPVEKDVRLRNANYTERPAFAVLFDRMSECANRHSLMARRKTKLKTVDVLLEESGLWIEDIAVKSNLSAERAEAIALGRWTPSPDERVRIAQTLEISVNDVSWGAYHGPAQCASPSLWS